ncbi:MAG: putative lipid II flippase FtsW [Nevskiales bacterium]
MMRLSLAYPRRQNWTWPELRMLDRGLLFSALLLTTWGLVMVASSSIAVAERQTGELFYYFYRQLAFASGGLLLGVALFQVPLVLWQENRFALLATALLLLLAVFLPGVGHEVNGAQRWLSFGPVNVQASEPARLCLIGYLASYLVARRAEFTLNFWGLLKPVLPIVFACGLLILQPDFGATVVLLGITLILLFLAGARLIYVAGAIGTAVAALALLAVTSPYRMRRLVSFTDPWQDPFDSGFQLSQALIAIGRGEWGGVGLGNSIQKLLYLPETHTDFLFAVLAEEFGLFGTLLLLLLFAWLIKSGFAIGARARNAQQPFGAYLAYGLTSWIGLQALVNIGVNMGLLPTKGLTLPLMSYGGSSLMVMCMAVALILRVDYEAIHVLPPRPLETRL